MGQFTLNGVVYEELDNGQVKVVGHAAPAASAGRIFTLPPNPKEVRQESRQDRQDARSEEDQRRQREKDDRDRREWIATHFPDGTPKPKPNDPANKPTEFQSKSAGFLGRMMQAEHDFGLVPETDRGPRSVGRQAFHNIAPGIENTLVNSPNRQKADQAVENFIAASLRQESGAAISPMEFERQYKIFYPAPGDSPEVIAQKAAARRQAIEDFKLAAGPLAEAAQSSIQRADNEVPDQNTGADDKPPPPAGHEITPEQQAEFFRLLKTEGAEKADAYLRQTGFQMKDPSATNKPYSERLEKAQGDYGNSYLGQGLSGANEGLGDVLGAPADIVRAGLNLIPKGLNAIAGMDLPMLPEPIGGGEWWKNRLTDIGSIQGTLGRPLEADDAAGWTVGWRGGCSSWWSSDNVAALWRTATCWRWWRCRWSDCSEGIPRQSAG
jgi:hypothetical protein